MLCLFSLSLFLFRENRFLVFSCFVFVCLRPICCSRYMPITNSNHFTRACIDGVLWIYTDSTFRTYQSHLLGILNIPGTCLTFHTFLFCMRLLFLCKGNGQCCYTRLLRSSSNWGQVGIILRST